MNQGAQPLAFRRLKRLDLNVMVPSIGANLGDPMDILVTLLVIQGHVEIQRAIRGFFVGPHPKELSIDSVADL